MPRKRLYADDADKQRAYRARKKRKRKRNDKRFCESEGCRGLRDHGSKFCKLCLPRLPFD